MKLVIDEKKTRIYGKYPKGQVDHVTSYLLPARYMIKKYRDGYWDGRVRFLKKDFANKCDSFPTGLLPDVIGALSMAGCRYEVEDLREEIYAEPSYQLSGIDISEGKYDYQARALDSMLMYGRGVVSIPTGGGKTVVGAACIASYGCRTVWFTDRLVLAKQSQKSLQKLLGEPVGLVGDGEKDIRRVTVAMVQTCSQAVKSKKEDIIDWLEGCELMIGDEIHHLESTMWYSMIENLPAKLRFGLSATARMDGPGMHIRAQTGPIIYSVGVSELIERGVIVSPRIWFVEYDGEKLDPKLPFQTAYSQGVVKSGARNKKIAEIAGILASEKKPTLILVNRINHGEHLCDLLSDRGLTYEWIHGKVSQQERDRYIAKLCDGQTQGIVAVASTMGEGVDIPELRAVINATGTRGGRSKEDVTGRLTVQILGRGLRTTKSKVFGNKTHFDYIDFLDYDHKYLRKASEARLETLENEGYAESIKYWRDYRE